MDVNIHFLYNSYVILTYFFIAIIALYLNKTTNGKSNDVLFSCYRSSVLKPISYVRLVTHIFGHVDWEHFRNNFLIILLIGPTLEEKYGSINLLIMIFITALITGIIHVLFKKTKLLGASGIAFMLILLSSFVNIKEGTVPLTLVLICLFYVIDEIKDLLLKKDHVSHLGHLIGALCGIGFGFYFLKYDSFDYFFEMIKTLF